MKLSSEIEAYVAQILGTSKKRDVKSGKLIRDALQDSYYFEPWEIPIIDSFFVQRLRRIHQTGMSFLTYPSALHTRFEHSLGVTIVADKIANSLKGSKKHEYDRDISDSFILELRVAGILHDIGHGPFSHATEEIYKQYDEIKELKKEEKFKEASEHEILSHLLITSKPFMEFLNELKKDMNIDLKWVGNLVIGWSEHYDVEKYKLDIMHGEYDADKLDYIPRDCYFTGLKMEVDLTRIITTMGIRKDYDSNKGEKKELFLELSGVPNLEQILFNKILLYSFLYHHHKIRSTVCMLKGFFEFIKDHNLQFNELSFDSPIDFLKIDDYDFLKPKFESAQSPYERKLNEKLKNFRDRNTLYRALVLCDHTLKHTKKNRAEVRAYYIDFVSNLTKPVKLREFRDEILSNLKTRKFDVHDIWIDIPDPPKFDNASRCIIETDKNEYVLLQEIFEIDHWLKSYHANKWKNYIFCPYEIRRAVDKETRKILRRHNIPLKKTASSWAKTTQ